MLKQKLKFLSDLVMFKIMLSLVRFDYLCLNIKFFKKEKISANKEVTVNHFIFA